VINCVIAYLDYSFQCQKQLQVMVCVMEDNQLQLKQLPCVGQEIDVDTYQSCSYKMIRSGTFKKLHSTV